MYSSEILSFTTSATSLIISVPTVLPYCSLISSILFIVNMQIDDSSYPSITVFPFPYKYSAEYNPVVVSFLWIFSTVFWYDRVFKTETILSLIVLKILVSKLSKACICSLSIIQYPI